MNNRHAHRQVGGRTDISPVPYSAKVETTTNDRKFFLTANYIRQMRKHIKRLVRSWGTHRVALRPYRRETGQYQQEIAFHSSLDTAEARLDLLRHGVNQAEALVSSCTMSFEAMPRLLQKRALAGPFMAMSRICLESAARLSYVYDDQISPDQRIMRITALWAWSNHESRKAASAMNRLPGERLSELTKSIDLEAEHLDQLANSSGFHVDRSGRIPVVRDPSGVCSAETAGLSMVDVLEKSSQT
jgi:hypothetical protein